MQQDSNLTIKSSNYSHFEYSQNHSLEHHLRPHLQANEQYHLNDFIDSFGDRNFSPYHCHTCPQQAILYYIDGDAGFFRIKMALSLAQILLFSAYLR